MTGVAILGALVNAHLGIPANFQSSVISAIETGTVPSSGHGQSAGPG